MRTAARYTVYATLMILTGIIFFYVFTGPRLPDNVGFTRITDAPIYTASGNRIDPSCKLITNEGFLTPYYISDRRPRDTVCVMPPDVLLDPGEYRLSKGALMPESCAVAPTEFIICSANDYLTADDLAAQQQQGLLPE